MVMTRSEWMLRVLCCLGAMGWVGCFSSHAPAPPKDSETHFLRVCDKECPGDLECICGVCSVTCDPASDCGDLDAQASCLSAEAFADRGACENEPTPSVCDVTCGDDMDCTALGATRKRGTASAS